MRWKAIRWGLVLGVVLFVGFVVHEVFTPLPKPVVGLMFVGFTHRPDGNYARVCFTNIGTTTVHYDGYAEVEIETGKGRKTYNTHQYTTAPWPYLTASNHISLVPIPDGTTQWQAKASYLYLQRRGLHAAAYDWAVKNLQGPMNWRKRFCRRVLGWVLDTLPRPKWYDGEATTPWLTNLPPAVVTP
jgi:hypothetical protein